MHLSTIKSSLLPFSSYSARLSLALGQYFCLGRLTASKLQSSLSLSMQQLREYITSQRQGSYSRGSKTTLAPEDPSHAVGPVQSSTAPNLCATMLQADEVPFRLTPLRMDRERRTPFVTSLRTDEAPFPCSLAPCGRGQECLLCDFALCRRSPPCLAEYA